MFLCGSSWQQLWKTQTKDILKELKTYFLQCHVCTTHKNNNNYCLFAWINQEKTSYWYSTNWSGQCNHESLHFGSCDIQPSSCVSWKLGHCMFGSQISILAKIYPIQWLYWFTKIIIKFRCTLLIIMHW